MKSRIYGLFVILFINLSFVCYSQNLVPCWDEINKVKKWGYSDRFYSTVVIKCEYDSTFKFSDGLAKVKLNGKYGYIDKSGKMVIPAKLESAGDFSEGFTLNLVNGRYQYLDKKGLDVFKKTFKRAANFSDGAALVSNDEDMAGFIDKKGNTIVPFNYKMALPFKNGLATVKEGDKDWKVINKKGVTVFTFPANVIRPEGLFNEGLLPVIVKDDKTGKVLSNFLDTTGRLLCNEAYIKVNPFQNGRAIVSIENTNRKSGNLQFVLYQLIDKKGNIVTSKKYSCLEESTIPGIYFYGNIQSGLSNCEGYGLMDVNGKEITEASYSTFTKLSDTAFLCREAGKSTLKSYLVLTTSGRKPIEISKYNKRFIVAGKDTLLVVYTDYGDKRYESIYNTQTGMIKDNISEGFISLSKQGLILFEDYKSYWGSLVSMNGKVLLDKIHTRTLRDYTRDDAPDYEDIPFLMVKRREDAGLRIYNLVTKKYLDGKYELGNEAFDYPYYYSEGMLAVRQNEKWGFIDSTGKLRIPCKYVYGGTFHDGWSKVRKAKGEFDYVETYVNKSGQEMPGVVAEDASDFFEGIAMFTIKPKEVGYSPTKLVYITKAGKHIFSSDVADIGKHGDFSNGMAAVCNSEGKYGYINTKGELVIPYLYKIPNKKEYTFYIKFNNQGFATVEKDGKKILIDKTGKEF